MNISFILFCELHLILVHQKGMVIFALLITLEEVIKRHLERLVIAVKMVANLHHL